MWPRCRRPARRSWGFPMPGRIPERADDPGSRPGAGIRCGGGQPGPARSSAPRSPDLGHGSMQLPVHLLHAEGALRRELPLHAPQRAAVVRGDRPARVDLRRARGPEDPADRRGAAPAPGARRSGPDAVRGSGARRPDPHHQRLAPDRAARPLLARRGARAADGEPGRRRRRGVLLDERHGVPRRAGAPGHRRRRRGRPEPDQGQHGGQAGGERARPRADGRAVQGNAPYRALHRVHGRRRDERMAPGRRRAGARDRRDDRAYVPVAAGGAGVSRRGRAALALRRRGGRDRGHLVGHRAVLRRLHPRAPVGGGQAVHLPVRDRRVRSARPRAQRRIRRLPVRGDRLALGPACRPLLRAAQQEHPPRSRRARGAASRCRTSGGSPQAESRTWWKKNTGRTRKGAG